MKDIFVKSLPLIISLLISIQSFNTIAMLHYNLSVKKFQENTFKIKIQNAQKKCSLVTDFTKQIITDKQNLFSPFQVDHQSHHTTFTNPIHPDCFLWNIPDFGLLKLHRDGSMFFGHNTDEAPLAHHELTLNSPGKLFLETLKVVALHIKSREAQLCETVIADRLWIDYQILNSGGCKTKELLGNGNFLNEALLEFEGTHQDPALLKIKNFCNKKNEHGILDAKVIAASKGFEWVYDAVKDGTRILNKHKGPTGLFIPYKEVIFRT